MTSPTLLPTTLTPATYTWGTAITPNTPSSLGGVVFSYGVQPALPAGLALDTTTGVIAGTPTAAAASYTVTATGEFTSVPLVLTVILPVLAHDHPGGWNPERPSPCHGDLLGGGHGPLAPLAALGRRRPARVLPRPRTRHHRSSARTTAALFDVVVTDALSRTVTQYVRRPDPAWIVDSFGG